MGFKRYRLFRLCGMNPVEFNSFKSPVTALDKLHAKHVLPGFADRSAEEREIEAATTDVTKVHYCPYTSTDPG